MHGVPDVTQDFALIDHLWVGYEPEDPDERERITRLAEYYRAQASELQVLSPDAVTGEERWVNVPPLVTRE